MKPNHTDERGTITDLIVTPDYSITHITFTEGAVRGNHYHKETIQYDFILKGKLLAVSQQFGGDIKEDIANVGDTYSYIKYEGHAYKAIEPSEMISICFGVRKGEDYEKDVIRLKDDEKLI